jgi:hypothetical protein
MLREFYEETIRTEGLLPERRERAASLTNNGLKARQVKQIARRTGLARLLRLLTTISIPPLWAEIAILHYRGSFQNKYMWVPVLSLPIIMAGGIASALNRNERRARSTFLPFALAMMVLGAVGTFFHLRGVKRQMGGFRNWKYNVMTGPPFPAPMQIMLTGALASAASMPSTDNETQRLARFVHLINIPSYVLFGLEAGWNHWMGGYYNKAMFVPVTLSPTMVVTEAASLSGSRTARRWQLALSAIATAAGLIGFGFHLWNISKRQSGWSWQSLFYGPPTVAPLQLTAQGIAGLLAAYYEDLE